MSGVDFVLIDPRQGVDTLLAYTIEATVQIKFGKAVLNISKLLLIEPKPCLAHVNHGLCES